VDNNSSIIEEAIKMGIIENKGAWYYYGKIKKKGQKNFIEQLVQENQISKIKAKVLEQ